ncbi:MAG: DUF4369 domain-containing protein [Bacteroidales bacterium]|jgi:hypothetical protein|nr:DUF4369 domain-containing protein [Bacteroidales bacterium]
MFLVAGLLMLIACKSDKVNIKGTFENCSAKYVLLKEVLPQEIVLLDTIAIFNGYFSYDIDNENITIYKLELNDTDFFSFIAQKGDKIELSADLHSFDKTYAIKGNLETQLLDDSRRQLDKFDKKVKKLSAIFIQNENTEHSDSVAIRIDKAYQMYFDEHQQYLKKIIETHPDKLASLLAFYQRLGRRALFDAQKDRYLLELLAKNLSKNYPQSEYVIDLNNRLKYDN